MKLIRGQFWGIRETAKIIYGALNMSKNKECVAVLIGLYKKNGAVAHVILDFLFIRTFTAVTGKDVGMHWYDLI